MELRKSCACWLPEILLKMDRCRKQLHGVEKRDYSKLVVSPATLSRFARRKRMGFYSKFTREYEDYLIRLIFGVKVENDPLSVCVSTAHLDFNRTLRGIGKVQNGAKLHKDSVDVLTESFGKLREILKTPTDQAAFDDWHREACASLISVYDGSFKVYGGQAQKWVNMTLKYFYTLGDEDEETLAAIVEGIQDAKAGRTVPDDEVRKQLPRSITPSSRSI
jgi:hypothetical protein